MYFFYDPKYKILSILELQKILVWKSIKFQIAKLSKPQNV
jgi:hypothetical protein